MSFSGPRGRRITTDDWLVITAAAIAVLAIAMQTYRHELPVQNPFSTTAAATTPATASPTDKGVPTAYLRHPHHPARHCLHRLRRVHLDAHCAQAPPGGHVAP